VLSLATNTVINTIATCSNPSAVVYNPAGTRIWVGCGGSNAIAVIDPATDTVVTTIANVGASPWGIAFNAAGTRAYTANYAAGTVSVIDTTDNTVLVPPITVGNTPVQIMINGDGTRAYVSNSGSNSVSSIDLGSGLATTIAVGSRPFGIAFHPDGYHLYVGNAGDFNVAATLSVVDTHTDVVLGSIPADIYSGSFGAFVTPYTPPGVPTAVSAAPGDGKATLSFAPPTSDGGLPITSYTATCGVRSTTGASWPLVVDQLTNGTPVACHVLATNAKGNGAYSANVSVTPAAVPTTDLAVSVSNNTGYVRGGSTISYTIGLRNQGANAVVGAHLTDVSGAGVDTPTWTCSSSDGATCPPSGTGDVDLLADLPPNTGITVMLQVHVPTLPETPLLNTVSVQAPATVPDTNAVNDTASDGPDLVGLFRDGFE
jgi:YVTN family beta-propeller protein